MRGWSAVFLAVWMAAGCGSRITAIVDEPFRAAPLLLSGFDPQEPEGRWRTGDSVLLGLVVRDGTGRERESYLRLTAGGKIHFESGPASLTLDDTVELTITPMDGGAPFGLRARFDLVMLVVETFDEHGVRLSRTTAMMPEPCLRFGLTEFIEMDQKGNPYDDPVQRRAIVDGVVDATPEQVRVMAGWLALMRLPRFMQREKSVNGIVQTVTRPPGLGSIIRNGGVSMALGMNPEKAERIEPPPPWSGACYRAPLEVLANGRKATECTLTVVRADPPLGPCGGLLALEASRPDDPERRLSVRLLAARRGKASP